MENVYSIQTGKPVKIKSRRPQEAKIADGLVQRLGRLAKDIQDGRVDGVALVWTCEEEGRTYYSWDARRPTTLLGALKHLEQDIVRT